MPQSSAALRQKAEALRVLRNPNAQVGQPFVGLRAPARPVWARVPFVCQHGVCLALELRQDGLWVKVQDQATVEAWAPVGRVLSFDQRREWARRGFG